MKKKGEISFVKVIDEIEARIEVDTKPAHIENRFA